jgi:hypothetical protein
MRGDGGGGSFCHVLCIHDILGDSRVMVRGESFASFGRKAFIQYTARLPCPWMLLSATSPLVANEHWFRNPPVFASSLDELLLRRCQARREALTRPFGGVHASPQPLDLDVTPRR